MPKVQMRIIHPDNFPRIPLFMARQSLQTAKKMSAVAVLFHFSPQLNLRMIGQKQAFCAKNTVNYEIMRKYALFSLHLIDFL